MATQWPATKNTFEINTRSAYGRGLQLFNHHESRLKLEIADPDIDFMYQRFFPDLDVYRTRWMEYQTFGDVQLGATMAFYLKMELVKTDWIRAWEGKVGNFYPEGTPEDKVIFPRRRAPFNSGTLEERFSAVKILADKMRMYPDLKLVADDADAKYLELKALRDAQSAAMSKVVQCRGLLETERINMCEWMYGDQGLFMNKYRKDPTKMERFFNIALLRKTSSEDKTSAPLKGTVQTASTMVVALPDKIPMAVNTRFDLDNTSMNTELWFYFAASASEMEPVLKKVVTAGDSLDASASELGWGPDKPFFIVKNNGFETGQFEGRIFVPEPVSEG